MAVVALTFLLMMVVQDDLPEDEAADSAAPAIAIQA
jgi:hypothetical protein